MSTNTPQAISIPCPFCQAEAGQKCQTVFSTRQADGTYLKTTEPARTHAKRIKRAAQA